MINGSSFEENEGSSEPFITLRKTLIVFKHYLYLSYVILTSILYNTILLKYKIIIVLLHSVRFLPKMSSKQFWSTGSRFSAAMPEYHRAC